VAPGSTCRGLDSAFGVQLPEHQRIEGFSKREGSDRIARFRSGLQYHAGCADVSIRHVLGAALDHQRNFAGSKLPRLRVGRRRSPLA
jgi:hypothetical protein